MAPYRGLNNSLAALSAVLLTSACSFTPERSAADYLAGSPAAASSYQMGKDDLAAGNYGLALGHFNAALERDPNAIAALNGEAIALVKLDRDNDAAAVFEKALKIDGSAAVTLTNYANFLERRGDHAKAAALLAQRDPPARSEAQAALAPATETPLSSFAAAPALSVEPAPTSPPAISPTADPETSAEPALAATETPIAPPAVTIERAEPVSSKPAALAVTETPKAATAQANSALTIWNSSGQYRLARRLQHYLDDRGFPVARVANAPRFDRTRSTLFCHAESREAAETVRRALPVNVQLVVLTSSGNRMELFAGRDLDDFDVKLASAMPGKGALR